MDRRTFLAAAAALAGSTPSTPTLAADGGKPVRSKPLRATYFGPEYYDDKELAQLREVLEKRQPFRWYGSGKQPPMKVLTFEKELAARMQTKYALAVTSGSAALQTAMAALEVGPGDEVILPAWTWYSCYNAIVLAGALPVFAEVDASFNLDPADLEARITPQTKVIMAVHLLGSPCDMDRILSIARARHIRVLEDCARASAPATRGGRWARWAMSACTASSSTRRSPRARGAHWSPMTRSCSSGRRATTTWASCGRSHEAAVGDARLGGFAGSQFRMSEFTGGVLLAQLRKLDAIVTAVHDAARRVHQGICDIPGIRLRPWPTPMASWARRCSSPWRTEGSATASSPRWPPRTSRRTRRGARWSCRSSRTSSTS